MGKRSIHLASHVLPELKGLNSGLKNIHKVNFAYCRSPDLYFFSAQIISQGQKGKTTGRMTRPVLFFLN